VLSASRTTFKAAFAISADDSKSLDMQSDLVVEMRRRPLHDQHKTQ
jgi:hypothetical protein